MAKILIIDDDELIRSSLARCFEDMGHEAVPAGNLAEGAAVARGGVDVIYLDIGLPDGDGHKVVAELSDAPGNPEVIVITGRGDNYGAQEALGGGAWDYIKKPATPAAIRSSLAGALKYRRERAPREDDSPAFVAGGIIGSHPSMVRARQSMAKAAASEAGVLILGETGVGKELAAQAIHANSPRRNKPFVVVDCSNLSETLLESVLYGHARGSFTGAVADHKGLVAEADGGTLFLDEVGELPGTLQKSFLRVLQEHRFRPVGSSREQGSDFRLVAATNRDLEAMTEAGAFRSDLLFRLRTVEVQLPPLRERGDDVLELAGHFVRQSCTRYSLPEKTLSKQLRTMLTAYAWPGNVRELGNALEAAVIAAGKGRAIYPKHLPGHIRVANLARADKKRPAPRQPQATPQQTAPSLSYADYKALRDRAYFQHLMDICDYDIPKASSLSGLSVPSIYRHLALAGISTKGRG